MDKQIIKDDAVYLVDENGWETQNPISISPRDNFVSRKENLKKSKKFYSGNKYVNILVNYYIGTEIFLKADRTTRSKLLDEASKQFKIEIKNKFGSLYKYQINCIKKRGFKNIMEYLEDMARSYGFYNYSDRRKYWNLKRRLLKKELSKLSKKELEKLLKQIENENTKSKKKSIYNLSAEEVCR